MSAEMARKFLEQNPLIAEQLEVADVESYVAHHAGNLIVLYGFTAQGDSVKMHESWGGDDVIVVHVYDTEDDQRDVVLDYDHARDALEAFTMILEAPVAHLDTRGEDVWTWRDYGTALFAAGVRYEDNAVQVTEPLAPRTPAALDEIVTAFWNV